LKQIIEKVIFLSMIFGSLGIEAKEKISFGVGMGATYSGLGINVSHLSKNDMKYVSSGCISYSSYYGSTCGVGAGWIKTDLLKTDSNKHGLGGYIGIVGREYKPNFFNPETEAKYGVGVGYHYFFNGIDKEGSNIGLTLVSDNAVFLQWGYQF